MNEKYKAKELIEHSMMGNLGIEILPEENGVVRARMPVNDKTSQPFGLLCGGASLAFAEILAGYGSFLYCEENQIPVGGSVFGNHISSVKKGENVFVHAYATCIHKGRNTHVWNVDIKSEEGRLVCSARVTNFVVIDRSAPTL